MPDFGIFRGFNDKLFGDKLYAGQLPTQLGIIGSEIVTDLIPILDIYTNAAAAYSLRLLRTNYTGSAIRVRRTDLQESDIGFTSSGDLDTTALLAFTGTGALDNGFVTTWYDQSGNLKNAIQTTAINQPQIVAAGVVLTNAGKPCLRFDNSLDALITTLTINRPYSIYGQFRQFSNGAIRMINSNSANNSLISSSRQSNTVFTQGNVVAAAYASINENVIVSLIQSAIATSKFFYNNTNIAIASPASNNFGVLCFGAAPAFVGNMEPANGEIKESIVWLTDQSSNNTAIQTNMNEYYGIY
jgi:hypothetical protein